MYVISIEEYYQQQQDQAIEDMYLSGSSDAIDNIPPQQSDLTYLQGYFAGM